MKFSHQAVFLMELTLPYWPTATTFLSERSEISLKLFNSSVYSLHPLFSLFSRIGTK
jgi:hypothetical protein